MSYRPQVSLRRLFDHLTRAWKDIMWRTWKKITREPTIAKILFRVYPPYLGAGIRVKHISPDLRNIVVEMPLRFYNRNYVGTHFGGSMYSMTDPFYMFMLLANLGDDYIVWDYGAEIRFLKPARGRIKAEFRITQSDIEEIKRQTADGGPAKPVFHVNITDESDQIVATIKKTLYVRRKTGGPRRIVEGH